MTIQSLRQLAEKLSPHRISDAEAGQIIKAAGSGSKAKAELQKIVAEFGDKLTGKARARLEKAVGGGTEPERPSDVSAATHKALMKTLQLARKSMGEPLPALPVGARYVEEPLFSEKYIDGYHFSAMIPVQKRGAPGVDPNNAESCYIKRSGGKTGKAMFFGPFQILRGSALKSVVVEKKDAGKTIKVKKNQDLVVSLQKAGGSGTDWFVSGTDRSFAFPISSEDKIKFSGPSACGGPVYQVMTWKTSSPHISAGGTHQIELELRRGERGRALEKFAFTVQVV
ncbi:MAG: protease inhibitor I42 family protein [Deltaproteobacteria bacterium]|nr:protease inhibitor I42 family protein [Deltaproteobacteria bacterium]